MVSKTGLSIFKNKEINLALHVNECYAVLFKAAYNFSPVHISPTDAHYTPKLSDATLEGFKKKLLVQNKDIQRL